MEKTYKNLLLQLESLLDGQTNTIANLANASALLYQTLPNLNWAGFYLYDKQLDELVLGPFQGKIACMHIAINKGVCGTSAYQRKVIRVDDVHQFPGHIACDSESRSEIVLPIMIDNTLFGVLDIDSPIKQRFSKEDEQYLTTFVEILKKHLSL